MADMRVSFHYVKSSAFRVVHADGVYGGPTPNGHIHLAFFSERGAIPTLIEHELRGVSENVAHIGQEIRREGKQGVVREVEVGVMMDTRMAQALYVWLGDNIRQLEAAMQDDARAPAKEESGDA